MNYATAELSSGTVNAYAIFLVICGLVLLAVAGTGFGAQSVASRVINVIVGLGFAGYGLYLLVFLKPGGSVWIFYYVFVIPVVLVIQAFRTRAANRQARDAAARQNASPYPPQQPDGISYPQQVPPAQEADPTH
jgi:hypothetical protein